VVYKIISLVNLVCPMSWLRGLLMLLRGGHVCEEMSRKF
jgi:hypothetical protein